MKKQAPANNKAYLYARVSSDRQEREGFSIPAQLDLLREYAARFGLTIEKEFVESETAGKAGRLAFNEMLQAVRSGKTRTILVEKTDRLVRNFFDEVEIDRLVSDLDLAIHYVKEGEIYSQAMTSHQLLIRRIKVALAENYVRNLSEECKKGQLQKLKQGGWPYAAPFGYRFEKKQLAVIPERAEFIKKAFELYATGLYSIKSCSDKLFQLGYLYKPPRFPKISDTRLHDMLRMRIYTGEAEVRGEIFKLSHEPIISMETWLETQKALLHKTKPFRESDETFIFRGLLHCGECGRLLSPESKKGGKITYYRCGRQKDGCSQGYVNEKRIIADVKQAFKSLSISDDVHEVLLGIVEKMDRMAKTSTKDERARLDREINKIENGIREAYQDKRNGLIDDALWTEIQRDDRAKIAILESRRAKLPDAEGSYYQAALRFFELPKKVATVWSYGSPDEKIVLLKSVTSNLLVKDGKTDIELVEPFGYLSKLTVFTNGCHDVTQIERFFSLHSAKILELSKLVA